MLDSFNFDVFSRVNIKYLVQIVIGMQQCYESEFRCPTEYYCKSRALLCDGWPDCVDESDEEDCPGLYEIFLRLNEHAKRCCLILWFKKKLHDKGDGS